MSGPDRPRPAGHGPCAVCPLPNTLIIKRKYMLLWIISLLTLAAAAADVIHYRRMRRRAPGLRHRVFIVAAAATDALPLSLIHI